MTYLFRILVVDDEPGIREILKEEFELAGAQVVEASSGIEALAQLRKGAFQAVLSDLRMPDGDGAWLLQQITSTEEWPELKFYMLTAYSDSKLDDALSRRMSGLFSKPFHVSDLISHIRAELGK